jgi:hypothetical protein
MIYKLVSDKLLKCLQDTVGAIKCALNSGDIVPKLTNTQRNALTPDEGDVIYSLTDHKLEYWNGTIWVQL